MMRGLSILMTLALHAHGATLLTQLDGVIPSTPFKLPPYAPLTNRYNAIVPVPQGATASLSWSNLTNAAKSTTGTATARKLLFLQMGTWTGSNAWPLTINSYVDIDARGSEIIQRSTLATTLPIIGDTDGSSTWTTTNTVYGGRWRATNNEVFIVAESASKIWFLPESAETRAVSATPIAIASQLDGEMHMMASDYLYAEHYDVFFNAQGTIPVRSTVTAPRAYCGDSLIELGSGYTNRNDSFFAFGYAEALASGGTYGPMFIGVHSNSLVHVDRIKLNRNCYLGSYGTNQPSGLTHYGIIEGEIIEGFLTATNGHVSPQWVTGGPWAVGTGFILQGFTYYGPTSVDPIMADLNNTLILRNVTVRPGIGATNVFRPRFAAGTVRLEGHFDSIPYLPKAAGITASGPTSYP